MPWELPQLTVGRQVSVHAVQLYAEKVPRRGGAMHAWLESYEVAVMEVMLGPLQHAWGRASAQDKLGGRHPVAALLLHCRPARAQPITARHRALDSAH